MGVIRPKQKNILHSQLSKTTLWYKKEGRNPIYGLSHGVYHHAVLHHEQELWELSQSDSFFQAQYTWSGGFDWTFQTLHWVLAQYVRTQGATPKADARLCSLLLRIEELKRYATENIDVVFDWFEKDTSRLSESLERLNILDDKNLCKACLFLILIEAERQSSIPKSKRDPSVPLKILHHLESRSSLETGFYWNDFIPEEFMIFGMLRIVKVWGIIDLDVLYQRGDVQTVITILLKVIKEAHHKELEGEIKYFLQKMLHIVHNREHRSWNRVTNHIREHSIALLQIVRELSRLGMTIEAQQIAVSISDEKIYSEALVFIVQNLCQNEQIDAARDITASIKDKSKNMEALSFISKYYAQSGDIEQALYNIESIASDIAKVHALILIVETLVKNKSIDELLSIRISLIPQKVLFLTKVAIELSKNQDDLGVKQVLSEAKRLAHTIPNKFRQSAAFSYLGICFTELGRIKEAFNTIECMSNRLDIAKVYGAIAQKISGKGYTDDAITLCNTITDEEQKNLCLHVIAQHLVDRGVVQKAIKVASYISNYDTYIVSLNTIVLSIFQSGAISQAIEIACTNSDYETSSFLAFHLLEACIKKGELRQKQIRSHLIQLETKKGSTKKTSKALALLSRALASKNHLDRALHISERIHHTKERVQALVFISKKLSKQGLFEVHMEVFKKISTEKSSSAQIFQTLSKVLEHISYPLIERLDTKALDAVHNHISHPYHVAQIQVFHALCLFKKGEKNRALSIYEHELQSSLVNFNGSNRVEIIRTIARDMSNLGLENRLLLLLEHADDWTKAKAYSSVVDILLDKGKCTKAQEVAAKTPNQSEKFLIFVRIYTHLVTAKKTEEAQSIYSNHLYTMLMNFTGFDTINSALAMIMALCKLNEIEQAMSLVDIISRKREKAIAMIAIAERIMTLGETKRAKDMYESVLMTIQTILDEWEKSDLVKTFINSLLQLKPQNRMTELCSKLLSISQSLNEELQYPILVLLAPLYAENGTILDFHNALISSSYSDHFYDQFLSSYQSKCRNLNQIRCSFLYHPFGIQSAKPTILRFMALHVQANNFDYPQAIMELCPEIRYEELNIPH